MRYFNEILRFEEKMDGANRRKQHMVDFRSALNFCGFHDLGFVGPPLT